LKQRVDDRHRNKVVFISRHTKVRSNGIQYPVMNQDSADNTSVGIGEGRDIK